MFRFRQLKVVMVIVSLLLLCVLLSVKSEAKWSDEVRTIIAGNRPRFERELDLDQLREKFAAYLYPFDSFSSEPVLKLEALEAVSPALRLSRQQALEDVEYLFSLLKYGYVGYQYFGGDERFLAARDLMIERLVDRSHEFSTFWFFELLCQHLDFINDGHFSIENYTFRHGHSMWMDFTLDFFRDEHGYYREDGEGREYVETVNGEVPDGYFWPALNSAGEVVYRIGKLEADHVESDDFELMELILRSGQAQRQDYAVLEQASGRGVHGQGYERFFQDGIPIISLKDFPDSPEMEQFVLDASELKHEDMLVIDLRGNRGGYGGHLGQWLDVFTDGAYTVGPYFRAVLATKTASDLLLHSYPLLLTDFTGGEMREPYICLETGWSEIFTHTTLEETPNPVKIVVLMDSDTVSAGEAFVEVLRHMENVVFLGTNTAGVYSTGNPVHAVLPNSGLALFFGTTLTLTMDSSGFIDREGIGFMPDFWVQPGDALETALGFIRKHHGFQ
ncbi:MAG: hypothetical protein GX249_12385 [Firmicutes bacterium]|nr:hypothetical protein [Bacillota bacterium]